MTKSLKEKRNINVMNAYTLGNRKRYLHDAPTVMVETFGLLINYASKYNSTTIHTI